MSALASIRAEASVIISAENRATQVVESAGDQIRKEFKAIRDEAQLTRMSFEVSNRSLVAFERVLNRVGRAASDLTSLYTKYNVMQLRLSDAARNVKEAEEDRARALAAFGPASEEAAEAQKAYEQATRDAERASTESKLAMIAMGLEGASAIGNLIKLIPQIQAFTKAIQGIGAASKGAAGTGALSNFTQLPGSGGKGAAGTGALSNFTQLPGSGGKGAGMVGKIAKGAGAAGGGLLLGAGILTSQALSEEKLTGEQKLMSTLESAGGGALLGATIGSIVPGLGTAIGAGIGAAAGTVIGLSTNYGEEFGNLFAGRGFRTNDDIIRESTGGLMTFESTFNPESEGISGGTVIHKEINNKYYIINPDPHEVASEINRTQEAGDTFG